MKDRIKIEIQQKEDLKNAIKLENELIKVSCIVIGFFIILAIIYKIFS